MSFKRLNIWILQTGEPLHIDAGNPRPMRAMNLANALIAQGHKVVLWSSAFNHSKKTHRTHKNTSITFSDDLVIRLIASPGYKRNIGIGRLYDHALLAKNLKKELRKTTELPDAAFVGYPPIEVAVVMGGWLNKNKVPYLVDVKDQWPSIFVESLPASIKSIGRFVFSPYFYLGKRVMKNATGLTAMSNAFLNWSIKFAGRTKNEYDRIVPLTKPDDEISRDEIREAGKWLDEIDIRDDGKPRVCFIGSHSQAFDMFSIAIAAKQLAEENNACQFVICGDGPYSDKWRQMMGDLPNVIFPGWINIAQSEALALRSIAALAPYNNVDNFILNLPNKVIDYMSQGLPVLSPLHGEVMELICQNEIGLSYGNDFNISLADCIKKLISDSELRNRMSKNALKLFQEEFSYNKVYFGFVSHIELMSSLYID